MRVRELIIELMNHDMDEDVFIQLGPNRKPEGSSNINEAVAFTSGITCGYGVYLIPEKRLEDSDV